MIINRIDKTFKLQKEIFQKVVSEDINSLIIIFSDFIKKNDIILFKELDKCFITGRIQFVKVVTVMKELDYCDDYIERFFFKLLK